jgi:DNA-binding transcriptional regulator LsrR (DeoR family)
MREGDDSLAIRAAWLHFAGGLTQADVAKKLGVTNVKAHRLIARASDQGAVKVIIDGEVAECARLEADLAQRYGLGYAEIVPDLGEEGLPLRALGVAGAAFLLREIELSAGRTIGIGHGRTLAAAVAAMPRRAAEGVRFVSLLGGLTRNYAANPHDVIHRMAEKTGASAFVMPVPFFANSAEDREVLLSQRGVREVFALAAEAHLKLVGIGTVKPDAQLVSSGMIERAEIAQVKEEGGVGEILGHFFDAKGRALETPLTQRTLALELSALKGGRTVAIAGGQEKIAAIRAVLASGYLSGLITDERSALSLLRT